MKGPLWVLFFALLAASALAGCRADAELDPDGRVSAAIPAPR